MTLQQNEMLQEIQAALDIGKTGWRFVSVLETIAEKYGWQLKNHRFISPIGEIHKLVMKPEGLQFENCRIKSRV